MKLRQRYDIIRLFLSKRAKPEIAAILDISLTQVYLILNLYKEAGIEGLGLKRPTGRQRKLIDEQEKELCSIITEKLPKEVGLEPYCNWTAPLACKYVKDHYGVTFSERGMRDVFYRLNLSYTRPTYVFAKADRNYSVSLLFAQIQTSKYVQNDDLCFLNAKNCIQKVLRKAPICGFLELESFRGRDLTE